MNTERKEEDSLGAGLPPLLEETNSSVLMALLMLSYGKNPKRASFFEKENIFIFPANKTTGELIFLTEELFKNITKKDTKTMDDLKIFGMGLYRVFPKLG